MRKTKQTRRRGYTRLSGKGQVTIPVAVLAKTGVRPGDELKVEVDEAGRILLLRVETLGAARRAAIERTAGSLPDVYEPGELDRLRNEWR